MSNDIYVLFEATKLPRLERWQEGIDTAGFPCTLGAKLDLATARGFQHAVFDGEPTGFEIYRGRVGTETWPPEVLRNAVGYDEYILFIWGASLTEMSAAVSSSAVLARLTNGLYFFPQDGTLYAGDTAIGVASSWLEQ